MRDTGSGRWSWLWTPSSAGLHWRMRVGRTLFSKLRQPWLSRPQAETRLFGLLSGLQAGQKLELVRPVARSQDGGGGGNVATFPSLPPTCLLWLVMVTRGPLLFSHTAVLVLGSSAPSSDPEGRAWWSANLRVYGSPAWPSRSAKGKWTISLTTHPSCLYVWTRWRQGQGSAAFERAPLGSITTSVCLAGFAFLWHSCAW